MCSKVLNGHIILTDTSITTILAPEMTYTPKMFSSHPDSEKRAARMKEKADAYVAAHQQ